MRSFSNLWFWIALAVLWSSASHWVLGVPFDMITRARRHGGQSQDEVEALAHIYAARILFIVRTAGLWLLGFAAFLLTSFGLLGFLYWVEFAQAIFLLALPMSILAAFSIQTARRIEAAEARGAALYRLLSRHRLKTQVVGVISIFVTAMWGMYQNMSIGVLGG